LVFPFQKGLALLGLFFVSPITKKLRSELAKFAALMDWKKEKTEGVPADRDETVCLTMRKTPWMKN